MIIRNRCRHGKLERFTGVLTALLLLMPGLGTAGEVLPKATPYSMDVYGYIPAAGVGDQISVFDPDGVLCGFFVVNQAGQYGFLHVYGDDPATAEDEGARVGDLLSFQINGGALSGPDVYWLGDRQRQQVDFNAK